MRKKEYTAIGVDWSRGPGLCGWRLVRAPTSLPESLTAASESVSPTPRYPLKTAEEIFPNHKCDRPLWAPHAAR